MQPLQVFRMHRPPSRVLRALALRRRAGAFVVRCRNAGRRRAVQMDRRQRPRRLFRPAAAAATSRSESIKPPPPPANPERGQGHGEARKLKLQQKKRRRSRRRRQGGQDARDASRSASNAPSARRRSRTLQRDRLCYRYNEKGEQVYLDDATPRRGSGADAAGSVREELHALQRRRDAVRERRGRVTSSRDSPG